MRTAPRKVSEDQRRQWIADAAYFRAERRGFTGGDPLHDWLEAESEVDARLHTKGGKHLLEEFDERLAVANAKLRSFKKQLSGMKADVREEWMQDVDRLAKLRDKFRKKLGQIRTQGDHASDKTKAQANKIWHELTGVIERLSSRKSGQAK